jgi:hypothetical protein
MATTLIPHGLDAMYSIVSYQLYISPRWRTALFLGRRLATFSTFASVGLFNTICPSAAIHPRAMAAQPPVAAREKVDFSRI